KGTSSASDRAGGASAFQANSIAVLPFVNTSGDEENKHFSDGLTDELISALGQVQGLKVAARTSVFALSGKGLGARAIADTLGVAKVIDGSARRIGKRLKVTAELVNAADNTVLWSQTFDREMVDVFTVQEEIARSIVGALNVRLTEDEGARLRGRPTKDLEAYDLYLKGRYSWSKRSREGMEAALAYFHSAVERDPSFALAHAGMSDAYVAMSNFNYMPVSEAIANAQIAADRALAIDSSLTEAHASKGFVLASRGEYGESEKELRRAIQLNPSYPSAHHYFTLLLMMLGRLDEATAQNSLTVSLDPFSVPGNATRGVLLCQRRNYAEARRALEKALPLGTGNILAPFYLGVIEAATGRYPESLSHLNRASRIAPGFPGVKAALAFTYSRLGRRAESGAALARLREAATDDRAKIDLAFAEAVMGDVNRAYTILGKSIKWDMPTVIELRTDPLLAAFRADQRYPKLLATIGLSN
ncbi:MAG: tetratricopeptide repeat protein, partial [Gemmatimonadaceae bacterium]